MLDERAMIYGAQEYERWTGIAIPVETYTEEIFKSHLLEVNPNLYKETQDWLPYIPWFASDAEKLLRWRQGKRPASGLPAPAPAVIKGAESETLPAPLPKAIGRIPDIIFEGVIPALVDTSVEGDTLSNITGLLKWVGLIGAGALVGYVVLKVVT